MSSLDLNDSRRSVAGYLSFLTAEGALPPAQICWSTFDRLYETIHSHFEVPWTSYTRPMAELTFAIAQTFRPTQICAAGTFVGYTLAWQLGDRRDPDSNVAFAKTYAFDLDKEANAIARRNCKNLGHDQRLNFFDCDAISGIKHHEPELDWLYLDLDSHDKGKSEYLDVLEAALPYLQNGALVLAHDALVPRFEADLYNYHQFVEAHRDLNGPWVIPIDECGLSIAQVQRRRENALA